MPSPFPITREHPPARVLYADETRSLEIRPWQISDLAPVTASLQASVAELRAFMPWAHLPITLEGQHKVLGRLISDTLTNGHFVGGIFGPRGEVLGGIGLHPRSPLNPNALEVGYWAATEHAGRGHVTVAVRALALLAIRRLGCDRFQVGHDEANVRSQRVVERCGFVYEGTLRNALKPGTPEMVAQGYRGTGSVRVYAIVPADLENLPWVREMEARVKLVDALGREQLLGS